MIGVTAALIAIAIGRDAQRIALLALIGGLLTPVLTGTGRDAQVVLFGYLLILDAGLLVLARARSWRGLEPVAFAGTVAYFWGWFATFYDATQPLARTAAFATLFFAVFAALPAIRARAVGRMLAEQAVQTPLNTGNYLLALHAMLWPEHRWALTAAVLGLAAVHLALARSLPRTAEGAPVARLLFAGLALTLVTLAIPIRLDGSWVTMAWAVEGAVLVWSGFRARWPFLRAAGLVLFIVAVTSLFADLPRADTFLLNARFGAFAVVIACLGAAVWMARREPEQVGPSERSFFSLAGVGVNVLALWALTAEAHQYFAPLLAAGGETAQGARLGRELATSLLWTLYGAVLVVAGVRGAAAGVRWQGIVLLCLAAGKVLVHDLSFLSGGHRILSSIAVGLALIGISVLYQRRATARRAAG